MNELAEALDALQRDGLYRRRRVVDGPQGPDLTIDGERCLAFCSNDYLGLATHPTVVAAFTDAAERYGVGSGAAHLVCGHATPHHELEEALAEATGRPRALLFSTGYMANQGVRAARRGRRDTVVEDRLNHASLIDAAQVSGARLKRYPHGDMAGLGRQLDGAEGRVLVASDGVFSMDGDIAPLPAIAQRARAAGAWLMVDDAHGFGVLGPSGGGSLEHYGLGADDVPILMGTLGKAMGTFGAFVAGSDELIETLIQRARSYIYTTAPPPAVAAATAKALALARTESWRREHLRGLVARFRRGAEALGLPLTDSPTPIQPLIVGEAGRALALADALFRRGIWVSAIRPPTVPQGSARLRVSFSAAHSEGQVDRLLEALAASRAEVM